jgi:hypothetical protein
LDLYFVDKELQRLCSSEKELTCTFGQRRGRVIAVRLTELVALPSLGSGFQVKHMRLHQTTIDAGALRPLMLILDNADEKWGVVGWQGQLGLLGRFGPLHVHPVALRVG